MTRPAVLETDPAVWRAEALDYIEARVRAGHTVTADDLRRDLPEPAHPNHVGQVFNILARRGIIERTRADITVSFRQNELESKLDRLSGLLEGKQA